MTLQVGVFVGTRADLGPLVPVLRALADADAEDLDASVATAIGFDARTLREQLVLRGLGLDVVEVGPQIATTEPAELTRAGSAVSSGVADWLQARAVDVLVLLGDRWELLYVAPPAVLLGVRIVHLHGGEITEGALDDRVRHALTKLADQHAVSGTDPAHIVAQLGEPPERIRVTGAPGLDVIAGAEPLDAAGWHAVAGALPARPVALVTVHPPTAADDEDPADLARAVLTASLAECATVVVTHPGPDPGREDVLRVIEEVSAAEPRLVVVPSIGARYAQVLRSVDVVVGNSSSGVIEAAAAGVPAVDVGARQAGRVRAASVRHAPADSGVIAKEIRAALAAPPATEASPYGDGRAAARIVDLIRGAVSVSRRKPFVRLEVEEHLR